MVGSSSFSGFFRKNLSRKVGARDIVNHIDSAYRTLTSREHRSLIGHSMGASGAFALAMTYPEVFGALAALSPSADFAAARHIGKIIAGDAVAGKHASTEATRRIDQNENHFLDLATLDEPRSLRSDIQPQDRHRFKRTCDRR